MGRKPIQPAAALAAGAAPAAGLPLPIPLPVLPPLDLGAAPATTDVEGATASRAENLLNAVLMTTAVPAAVPGASIDAGMGSVAKSGAPASNLMQMAMASAQPNATPYASAPRRVGINNTSVLSTAVSSNLTFKLLRMSQNPPPELEGVVATPKAEMPEAPAAPKLGISEAQMSMTQWGTPKKELVPGSVAWKVQQEWEQKDKEQQKKAEPVDEEKKVFDKAELERQREEARREKYKALGLSYDDIIAKEKHEGRKHGIPVRQRSRDRYDPFAKSRSRSKSRKRGDRSRSRRRRDEGHQSWKRPLPLRNEAEDFRRDDKRGRDDRDAGRDRRDDKRTDYDDKRKDASKGGSSGKNDDDPEAALDLALKGNKKSSSIRPKDDGKSTKTAQKSDKKTANSSKKGGKDEEFYSEYEYEYDDDAK